MSDVFAKRRPMIDLDEFERRLSRPCSTDPRGGDPLAELLRIIGSKDEPQKTDFEPTTQLPGGARPDEMAGRNQPDAQAGPSGGNFAAIEAELPGATQLDAAILREAEEGATVHDRRPNARAPLIKGDFAAIEAGLLGAPSELATATVPETDVANGCLSVDLGSERWLHQDNPTLSHRTDVTEEHIRSRLPLYAMMVTIVVGVAAVAVSVGLNSRFSGSAEIAPVKANGPTNQAAQAPDNADTPSQTAALSNLPERSPAADENGAKQRRELTQGKEKPPAAIAPVETAAPVAPAESAAPIAPVETAAPVAPVESAPPIAPAETAAPVAPVESAPPVKTEGAAAPSAQTPAEPPPTMATAVESDKAKTDVVQPDSAALPNSTSPEANVNGMPLSAPQSPAATKAPKKETAARVVKPSAAARHRDGHGRHRHIANKAKPTPVNLGPTEPVPSTGPTAETPTTQPTQPAPATNGPFGFVQSAMDSLTSTAAKLLGGQGPGRN